MNFIAFLNVYNVEHTINIPRYRTIFTHGQNKCEQVTSFKVFCNNCLNAPLDISTATTPTTTKATSRRIKDQKKANKTLFLSYIFIHKPTKRATTFLSSICMQSVCWAMCHSGNHINWYRLVVVKLLLLVLPQRIYLHNRALANTLKSTIFEQCSNNEEKNGQQR